MEVLKKIDNFIRVKQEADWKSGSQARWSNEDLDPVPRGKRTWGTFSILSYWCSDQFSPSAWSLGASMIGMGLTCREAIPITFFGFLMCAFIVVMNGTIGVKTHCSFPVLVRMSLGMWGSFPAIIIRCILSLLWLAIQTYLAGNLTAELLGSIWPSFLRIENTLPEGLGITTQTLIGFVLYWVVQTPVSCIPVHKMRILFLIKALICPVGYMAIGFWALGATGGKGEYLSGSFNPALAPSGSKAIAVVSGLNALAGLYSTLQVNVPDFVRFAKSSKANWWQILFIPLTGTLPVAAGIWSTAAATQLYGVETWDAAGLISLWGSSPGARAAKFFAAAMFLLSALGVNISANSISFATDIVAVCPRYFTIMRATIAAGILTMAINPWSIVNGSSSFYAFIQAYPCFLAPIAVIMGVDFWVVRKGKIDIRDLYDGKGPYYYFYGFNLRAYAAWICALAPNLPGLAHAVDPANPDVQPYTYYFSWGFAVAASALFYWVICLVFPPRASLVDRVLFELDELDEMPTPAIKHDGTSSEGDIEKKAGASADILAV
ncbi:hypothetical protein JCM10207_002345 [Rhodosporidiobolus poonsookiae]